MSVLCSWDIFITLDSCFSEINWHSVSNLSDSEGDVKSQTFVYIRRLTRHTVRICNRGTMIDKLSKRTSETTQWLKKKKRWIYSLHFWCEDSCNCTFKYAWLKPYHFNLVFKPQEGKFLYRSLVKQQTENKIAARTHWGVERGRSFDEG